MNKEILKELDRKIWITKKSRIQTSERLKQEEEFYQNLLIYYTIVTVCLSIWGLQSTVDGKKIELIILLSSIVVSLFAVYIKSKNYQERYYNMRNNYLDLDNLLGELKEIEVAGEFKRLQEIRRKYTELLKYVENHTAYDFLLAMKDIPGEKDKIPKKNFTKLKLHEVWTICIQLFFISIPVLIIVLIRCII